MTDRSHIESLTNHVFFVNASQIAINFTMNTITIDVKCGT